MFSSFRHNQSELSTDGIDLSSSCSFNLRDRTAWQLAMRGGGAGDLRNSQLQLGSGDSSGNKPRLVRQEEIDTTKFTSGPGKVTHLHLDRG